MQRLQYRLRPSLRARQMPNCDSGSDSSHLGHLFNSTTLNSAVLVTSWRSADKIRAFNLVKTFARQRNKPPCTLSPLAPFMNKFLAMNPDVSRKNSPSITAQCQTTCTATPSPLNACDATRIEVVRRNG